MRIRPDGKGIAGNPEASRRIPYLANLPHESKGRHEKKSCSLRNLSVVEWGKRDWRAGRSKPFPGETGFFPRQKRERWILARSTDLLHPFPPEKRGQHPWPLFVWKIREKILPVDAGVCQNVKKRVNRLRKGE
ncbi:hypothetical protein B4135_2409 [Caldibacillus debilis]|uniref:Uncharacterized protein n=1 Tax=Caldibacillus debilis TaxID=301148 RepID=A0A150LZM3_9BACI|nr:hypothetical protein B4135_2409 [Caldibacillus debilis]